MYTFSPHLGVGEKLSNTFYVLYLSMLRYLLDASSLKDESPKVIKWKTLDFKTLDFMTYNLKVVIAAGLTSSHPEQSS